MEQPQPDGRDSAPTRSNLPADHIAPATFDPAAPVVPIPELARPAAWSSRLVLGAGLALLMIGVLVLLAGIRAAPPILPGHPAPPASPVPGSPLPTATGIPSAAPLTPAPFSGSLAPDFSLPDLTGTTVRLSQFRGQPVWINLWATWCPPCRAEMPEMQKLYVKYKGQGLVVLGVDYREDKDTVVTFVQDNGFAWQFLLDPTGTVARSYYVTGIPTHVFVDRRGVIQALPIGGLDPASMETNLARILAP